MNDEGVNDEGVNDEGVNDALRTPVLLYDGDCAFCSSSARFIERRIPAPVRVLPWQHADLDALGLTEEQCLEAVQWVDRAGDWRDRASGPAAIAAVLRSSAGAGSAWLWRALGRILGTRPMLIVADPVYRWVARNRHRMPGGTAACALPE